MVYQLLKTSPLLGGQIQLDLSISDGELNLLQLSPISDNIIFNEGVDHNIYNYSHGENIKRLYKKLGSEFYSTIGRLGGEDVIYNQNTPIDPFDHTYETGLKRMRYQRYNKQFSFFCPMWISEVIDFNELEFELYTTTPSTNYLINKKTLRLSNKLAEYLNSYMSKSANGSPVGNDLVSFKFDPIGAYIMGLNVESGIPTVANITDIIYNLTDRERPLMESDNIILRTFEQHHIIAQQLLNFNIVFNFEDFTSKFLSKSLSNTQVNVYIKTRVGGEYIDMKDMYSNYTSIPSYNIETSQYDQRYNVLDYLNDHMCQDLAYTNKTTQPIFHWSLLENPNIIYNFYGGFGPIYIENGEVHRVEGVYYNQTNVKTNHFSIAENSLGWCKHHAVNNKTSYNSLIQYILSKDENYTLLHAANGITWFNSNKFDFTGRIDEPQDYYICTIKTIGDMGYIPDDVNQLYSNINNVYLHMYMYNNLVAFISNSNEMLLVSNIYSVLNGLDNLQNAQISQVTKIINTLYETWIPPYKIEFFKGLQPRLLPLDGKYSEVCDYGKIEDSYYSYVYRYTGKIIPYFIDPDDDYIYNISYRYKQWGDDDMSIFEGNDYLRLLKFGYKPKYMKSSTETDGSFKYSDDSFYALVSAPLKTTHDIWYDDWCGDRTWLFDNSVWDLKPDVYSEVVVDDYRQKSQEDISKLIWDRLFEELQLPEDIKTWVLGQYMIQSQSFDYESIDNVENITYKTNFRLK